MSISGVSSITNPYQTLRAGQQQNSQSAQSVQANSNANPATQQTNASDPDNDGDVDGLGKDIDVRV
jgi:hypothetical protein